MRSAADLAESTRLRVMRAAVCPAYGPPEVVRVEDRPSPTVDAGQVRVRVGAAAVNFPDVLLVANEYQISVPPPFVPGSEFAGVIVEIGDGDRRSRRRRPGHRHRDCTAPSPRRSWCPPPGWRGSPTASTSRTAAAFGVAYRTAYHTLRSMARVQAGDDVDRARRRRRRRPGGGSARRAAGRRRHGCRVVGRKARCGSGHTAPSTSSTTRRVTCARRCEDALPGGADAVIDPVGGELSEPALRSLRRGGRFVTVGFASGVIPRIPLNLVLVKGVHVARLPVSGCAARRIRPQ